MDRVTYGAKRRELRSGARRVSFHLQVLQRNEGEGGSHGDAESEARDQPRDPFAIHLPSPLIRWPGLRV
jgi:hypothetical protein